MKVLKKLLPIAMVFAMLSALLVPGAVLATEGDDTVGGTFGAPNNAPTVAAPVLYQSDETNPATSVDPQTQYAIKVDVTDIDGISDLSTVVVTLMYDSDNNWATGTGGQDTGSANIPGSGNVNYAGILTVSSAGITAATINAAPATYFSVAPASSTWAVETAAANKCNVSDSGSTRTFWFHFKAGTVASEADGTSQGWHIYALATDASTDTGNNNLAGQTMNFYSQAVVGPTSVDFSTITVGGTWTDDVNEQKAYDIGETPTGIQWIANGAWAGKVKNSGNWGGTNFTATFVTITPASAQEFALKALNADTIASATIVTTAAAGVATGDSGTITLESPTSVDTEYLWLLAHATFSKDTYTGTITYICSNN